MIRRVYVTLYFLTLFTVFAALLLSTIFFQKDIVPYLARKYLKEYGVEYRDIEGTIFSGVILKGVKYKRSIEVDELRVEYNLLMLINPTPRVRFVSAKGVFVDADEILEMQSQDKASVFALNVSKIDLQGAEIQYKEDIYALNMTASDVSLRDTIDAQKIAMEAQTPYASLTLEGSVKAGRAKGKSTLLLSEKTSREYLDFLIYTPSELELFFDLSSKEADIKTSLTSVAFKDVENLVLNNIDLHAAYNFSDDFFTLFSNYSALYEKNEIAIEQKSTIAFHAEIVSNLDAKIVQDALNLPFESFSVDIKKDDNLTEFAFTAKEVALNAQTKNFKDISLKAQSIYADLDAKVELKSDAKTLMGELYLKSDAPYLREYDIERFSKLNLFVLKNQESMRARISTDNLSLTLFEDEKKSVVGVLQAGSSTFDIKGDIKKREFLTEASIESLRTLISDLKLNHLIDDESPFFDASAIISAKIGFDKRVEVDARIDVPRYKLELDTQNIYTDKDAYFEFFYTDGEITLQKYDFGILQERIYSKKPSKIVLGKNGMIVLKEFWVFDELLLSGELNYSDMSADVTLKGDTFHYESDDANVTLKVDLQAAVERNGTQSFSGDIDILEGVVSYVPKKEYAIKDEDIIIIQDIKSPKKEHEKRELNIRVYASKPLKYKIKDVELLATPNLVLYQEFGGAMQILGLLRINSGVVTLSEREFEFDESEIYFNDEEYVNPYLNLNLHYYTFDNIDIEIYITNRVESPVFILSSNPQMSQNDIMSYILFGGSTSSVFDTTDEESKTSLSTLALGTGLKGILNRSTNLKIDTLNILTNEDGTLGYEIGKRFGKKLRLIYMNDDISSLTLQYSLNRFFRIDVDVKETGQGIGIFYIKDFKLKE